MTDDNQMEIDEDACLGFTDETDQHDRADTDSRSEGYEVNDGDATPEQKVTGDSRHEATADGGTEPTDTPQAPSSLPKYMIDGVEKQSPEDLRDLAAYAGRMAEW
mgnify:CR=1 FL=1